MADRNQQYFIDECIMFKCVQIMCAKYYELRYIKNCTSSKLARLLDGASKFVLFLVSGLKDEKLIKKQTYVKTETRKLYCSLLNIQAKFHQNGSP